MFPKIMEANVHLPDGQCNRLWLQITAMRGKKTLNLSPWYDIKWSDGGAPLMLELWGMWSAPSLSLLTGHLWPGVVAHGIFGLDI